MTTEIYLAKHFGIIEECVALVKQEKKHKNKVSIKDEKGRALNILL